MRDFFSDKQWEFILNANAKWNIAHGAVRAGKTMAVNFRFMQEVHKCPDNHIAMIGYTSETIYRNVVKLILEDPTFEMFRPFCKWTDHRLLYRDKTIRAFGASNEGAVGAIQGQTFSLVLCDEITLYPDSIIDMIDSRLSMPHSKAFATCNPSTPTHKIKQWVDRAVEGDPDYYELKFLMDDNLFLTPDYKARMLKASTGLHRKRNIEGHWCMAEGAIFDCFDKRIHVIEKPRHAAEYWIAAVDYGTINPFACVLIGVNTGKFTQTGKYLWVEKEYYWDQSKKGRQKTNGEFATDLVELLEPYGVKNIYIDPSAAAMKEELRRKGFHPVDANNEVEQGIQMVANQLAVGNLFVMDCCPNLIREIEGYVWDAKAAKKGYDEPLKQNDHAVDALRYAIASHKVPKYYGNDDQFGRTLGFRK